MVGPTGAGRHHISPIPHDRNAANFDGVDDVIISSGFPYPANGTFKPYGQLTVSIWWRGEEAMMTNFLSPAQALVDANSNGGWSIAHQNKRIVFNIKIEAGDDGDGDTGINVNAKTHQVMTGYNA